MATQMNFVLRDYDDKMHQFELPLSTDYKDLFNKMKQRVMGLLGMSDQTLFWSDGYSLCSLNCARDLEAAVDFSVIGSKIDCDQPLLFVLLPGQKPYWKTGDVAVRRSGDVVAPQEDLNNQMKFVTMTEYNELKQREKEEEARKNEDEEKDRLAKALHDTIEELKQGMLTAAAREEVAVSNAVVEEGLNKTASVKVVKDVNEVGKTEKRAAEREEKAPREKLYQTFLTMAANEFKKRAKEEEERFEYVMGKTGASRDTAVAELKRNGDDVHKTVAMMHHFHI